MPNTYRPDAEPALIVSPTVPPTTVKFVLPSAPGSTTDILTRLTADALGRKWGKPTIVENISGGSMNIGAGQAFPAHAGMIRPLGRGGRR